MAHISGLVVTGVADSPFKYCDVVTTTTHKSLRGPRAGMIFARKNYIKSNERKSSSNSNIKGVNLMDKINFAVFPSLQGGPHNNTIAGIATQLREAQSGDFKKYSQQVVKNSKVLAEYLISFGYTLCTGGTDNHLILWDLRPIGLTGSKLEKVCDLCHITLNKNSVPGDKSAFSPGGVRIGTPALTTRGFTEEDFKIVAHFLDRAVQIAIIIQNKNGKLLKNFVPALENNYELNELRDDVIDFSSSFNMPGI